MVRKKSILKQTVGDWKHWMGWILTTGIIIIVFHLMGVHILHTPLYHAFILLFTIVVVDVIKHYIKLQ